jgi:2-amino-4-hydroxy-6-hydroxymethyldihydropteridine diphosphokinase
VARSYVGIGSNLGDRTDHLLAALDGLRDLGRIVAGSPVYETAPVGDVEQGPYLNAAVALETDLSPGDLLAALLSIERTTGRVRDVRWGPRTLDLDLLWYDGQTISVPDLEVPHREIRNRRFVLVPLTDIDPSLGDDSGPYADALDAVEDQPMKRVTGPLHRDGTRWLVGIEDAMSLRRDTSGWTFDVHTDWANNSGDVFGAYVAAVALLCVRDVAPDMAPVSLVHRFLHGIRAGSTGSVIVDVDRRSERALDATVSIVVDGERVGRTNISAVANLPGVEESPEPPRVHGIASATPIDELVRRLGFSIGASALNWRPLENWSIPDMWNGDEAVLRLWSPNVALGSDDRYLMAAALLMPVDAGIWPAIMQNMDRLPDGPAVYTPTIELSAHFADLRSDDRFHLAEAWIDHRSASTAFGAVRMWGMDGTYRGIGHSRNLVRAPRPDDL